MSDSFQLPSDRELFWAHEAKERARLEREGRTFPWQVQAAIGALSVSGIRLGDGHTLKLELRAPKRFEDRGREHDWTSYRVTWTNLDPNHQEDIKYCSVTVEEVPNGS